MRVRLLRNFAERIDDIDLRSYSVGDTLEAEPKAQLLVAAGWAVVEGPTSASRDTTTTFTTRAQKSRSAAC